MNILIRRDNATTTAVSAPPRPQNATAYPINKVTPIEGTTIIHPKTATDTTQQHRQSQTHMNGFLLAAVAIISLLLGLVLALAASFLYKRVIKKKRRAAAAASEEGGTRENLYRNNGREEGSLPLNMLYRGKNDSETNSIGKYSRSTVTCDTSQASTRKLYMPEFYGYGGGGGGGSTCTPSPISGKRKYAPSTLRMATSPASSHCGPHGDDEIDDSHHREEERMQESRAALTDDDRSFQFEQALLESPILGKVLTEKFDVESPVKEGHFDWSRCAFEENEEEAMWLPSSRSESQLGSRYNRGGPSGGGHGRAASDPTLLLSYPPKAYFVRQSRGASPHSPLGRQSHSPPELLQSTASYTVKSAFVESGATPTAALAKSCSPRTATTASTMSSPSNSRKELLNRQHHPHHMTEEERRERRRLQYERLRPRTSPTTVRSATARSTMSTEQLGLHARDDERGSEGTSATVTHLDRSADPSSRPFDTTTIELDSPSQSNLMTRRGALVAAMLPVSR